MQKQAQEFLRPGDTLVVQLRESRGIGFKSLQENIDTTTSGGKLIFHIFAPLAEFERYHQGADQCRADGGTSTGKIGRASQGAK